MKTLLSFLLLFQLVTNVPFLRKKTPSSQPRSSPLPPPKPPGTVPPRRPDSISATISPHSPSAKRCLSEIPTTSLRCTIPSPRYPGCGKAERFSDHPAICSPAASSSPPLPEWPRPFRREGQDPSQGTMFSKPAVSLPGDAENSGAWMSPGLVTVYQVPLRHPDRGEDLTDSRKTTRSC